MRAHAHEFGYNADTIMAWGNSAGGHILEMCCATNGKRTFEDLTMGYADQSSDIQGLIAFYSPSNLYQAELDNYISVEELHALAESPEGLDNDRPGMALNSNIELGCRALDNPAIAAMASPINFVTKDFPPTYFVQGLADPVVAYTQTTSMYNKVVYECGEDRAKMDLIPGAVHGDPAIKADEITKKVFDFVDTIVFGKVRQRPELLEVKTF